MSVALLDQLGQGGMGALWKGRDEQTGREFVVEAIDPSILDPDTPQPWAPFQTLERISSAYVSRTEGCGVYEGLAGILFELPDGPSYRDQLAARGPLDWQQTRVVLKQMALALIRVHAAGALAGSLDTSVVFAGRDGLARLAGYILSLAPADPSAAGVPGGPGASAGVRADLDALGRLIVELLGVSAGSAASDLSNLPEEARSIVSWLLAPDPAARPQSAQEVLSALGGQARYQRPALVEPEAARRAVLIEIGPTGSRPAGSVAGSSAIASRRPLALALAGVAAVVVIVGGLVALATEIGRHEPKPTAIYVVTNPTGTAGSSPTSAPTPTPVPTPTPAPVTPRPPLSTTWSPFGRLDRGVWGNGISQLPNGSVLVFDSLKGSTVSVLVDPNSGAVTPTGALKAYQSSTSIAVLQDGSVLAIGGFSLKNDPLNTVQRFYPNTGQWTLVAPMNTPRTHPTVTVLSNGQVLVAGGWSQRTSKGWIATNTAEIYDPVLNTWSSAGHMAKARALASAVRLMDGRVLVTGGATQWLGTRISSTTLPIQTGAEIYDPAHNAWTGAGQMAKPRAAHASALLTDGRVLVISGWQDKYQTGMISTEIYDPRHGHWSNGPVLSTGHAQGRLVQLQDGRPMIVGGIDGAGGITDSVEVYDPVKDRWESAGLLAAPVYWPLATVLDDGRVMVVGGVGANTVYQTSIQMWIGPSGNVGSV